MSPGPTDDSSTQTKRRLLWGAVAVLAVLHWDFWFWDDRTILFGFLPIGLAYHMGYSIAAASLWWLALSLAWPDHIEEWAESDAGADEEAAG